MAVGSDINAPWHVGAAGPDPSWTQEQEGSAWNGFYSVVTRKPRNRTTKTAMRSMTYNMIRGPPGLRSLSTRPQEEHTVNIENASRALSVKDDDEEQDGDDTSPSIFNSCSRCCGCASPGGAIRRTRPGIKMITKSELLDIKLTAKAWKEQKHMEVMNVKKRAKGTTRRP